MTTKSCYRRCQECGYVQRDYDFHLLETERAKENFNARVCKRCMSPALDRGTYMVRKTEDWGSHYPETR